MKKKMIMTFMAGLLIAITALGLMVACWIGCDTPEDALEYHRINGWRGLDFDERNYEVQTHFATLHFQDGAMMVYLASFNNLMVIDFPRNPRNQTYYASAFRRFDLLNEHTINRLEDEEIIGWWQTRNTKIIYAVSLSSRQAYVNGVPAETIRFEVVTGNVTHNLQFWHKELQGRNAQFIVEYRDIN